MADDEVHASLQAALGQLLNEQVEVEDRLRHGDFFEHKKVTGVLSELPAEDVVARFRTLSRFFRWLAPQEQNFIRSHCPAWSDPGSALSSGYPRLQ